MTGGKAGPKYLIVLLIKSRYFVNYQQAISPHIVVLAVTMLPDQNFKFGIVDYTAIPVVLQRADY